MTHFLKQLFIIPKNELSSFFKGFTISGFMIALAIFFAQLVYDAYQAKPPVLKPSKVLISELGKPNVEIAKFPLQIWRINNEKMLGMAEDLLEKGTFTLGSEINEPRVGDYIFFLVESRNGKVGYIASYEQIEATYSIKKL